MTMRKATTLTIVMLLALAGGCQQNHHDEAAATGGQPAAATPQASEQTAQASVQMTPEQLGELGAQIQKAPDRANDLLTQHGLTAQSFEAQIRKVTENPDASKRYATAFRKARA
jgi:hypothetical protein